jgi:4-aminobutyrate aminotransferase-like enzyme
VDAPDLGDWFADQIQQQIDDMAAHGIKFAGFLADSIFSSDGVLPDPRGFLKKAVEVVHANGGIFIADEVQPGFGRTGDAFWGFGRHDVVPDIITTGKPMGNGIPVSGLLAKSEVLAAFSDSIPYFNTFGGNPVAMAAAQAVLKVITEEGLQEHSRVVGAKLLAELRTLMDRYECVGDVRGAGLFIGFELVTDRHSKTPDKTLALDLIEKLREHRVLTSVAGPYGNVLKLRPPLAFQEGDIDWLVGALDSGLRELGR